MKLENTGQTYMDLDFDVPQKGKSVLEFDQGMTKMTNSTSGKTSLRIPFRIIDVLEGPETNLDARLSHFCPIATAFGEKQIANILTMTGQIEAFAKRFNGDVDIASDEFVDFLKAKLLGQVIVGHHEIKKDQSGKDRANITRFEAFVKGTGKTVGASKKVSTTLKGEDGERDWG